MNDRVLGGDQVLTGARNFTLEEIEVFEVLCRNGLWLKTLV
jgi:hypothetical protein